MNFKWFYGIWIQYKKLRNLDKYFEDILHNEVSHFSYDVTKIVNSAAFESYFEQITILWESVAGPNKQ